MASPGARRIGRGAQALLAGLATLVALVAARPGATALVSSGGAPLATHGLARAQALAIAAASDLQYVMPALTERFTRATGQRVTVTYGSSGNFFSQIQHGAPFDLFFSADVEYPRRLAADGLVEPGSVVEYATGRIVLWWRKERPLPSGRGLAALLEPGVRRVAIANPEHAPYGRAAVAALRHARLYDQVRAKLVRGENVAQAAQFVESGNADAGILALSLALAPGLKERGAYYEVPEAFHLPITQAAAIINASRHKDGARAFLAAMRAPDAIRAMQAAGFRLPAEDGRAR